MVAVSLPTIRIGSNVLRTWNGRYLHTTKEPIMNSLLDRLAAEMLVTDIDQPSAVLARLSDDDLEAAHDDLLEHFALEPLIGAHRDSHWAGGNLVIAANHGPIHLLQAAFYAVKLEVQRRNAVVC